MTPWHRPRPWLATLALLLISQGPTRAGEPTKADTPPPPPPGVGLLDAMRAGTVSVDAEGRGDGTMTLSVTNLTGRKLKVVLPPGLIASGATGQFGGMGGMGGGGMGGMGGGGMGGMGGGGMGGMGGGMGGGGMGGRSGGMGGGSSGGRMLTMMPLQGLSSVANMIMNLVEPETWDRMAFRMGMMAAMGSMGGGMGGMGGGGMGGMGGGMGGMGGGFRSVPPTDLPTATLKPGQTRRLATALVSLNPPSPESGVRLPQEGERLVIGDVAQIQGDPVVQKALRRLAADKAPEPIAQLVMWNLAGKLDWMTIDQLGRGWVNAQELALARQFVERLDAPTDEEPGRIYLDVTAGEAQHAKLADELGKALAGRMVLGLKAAPGVPERPTGPSVGCKVLLVGGASQPEAMVKVAESDGHKQWASMGKFTLAVPADAKGGRDPAAFGDKLAEGLLDRLVRARMIRRKKTIEGTTTYTIQVDNASPLVLNGLAIVGDQAKPGVPPHYLLGLGLAPQHSIQLPLTPAQAESFGMKKGSHLVALDLSAL